VLIVNTSRHILSLEVWGRGCIVTSLVSVDGVHGIVVFAKAPELSENCISRKSEAFLRNRLLASQDIGSALSFMEPSV